LWGMIVGAREAVSTEGIQMANLKEPGYKRPLDLTLLISAHILLLPFWLFVWTVVPLLIWAEDRGPVFYRQARYGLNGRVFYLLKFRSMMKDADKVGAGWTGASDPRITRIGAFLRRTALDEVPQVVNVLRGDISLVGPRALPLEMHERATIEEPLFPARLRVRPGGTGLALLHGPRHCSPRRRLRYDLLYVENVGFWLDLKILALTVWLTLIGRWGTGFRRPEEES